MEKTKTIKQTVALFNNCALADGNTVSFEIFEGANFCNNLSTFSLISFQIKHIDSGTVEIFGKTVVPCCSPLFFPFVIKTSFGILTCMFDASINKNQLFNLFKQKHMNLKLLCSTLHDCNAIYICVEFFDNIKNKKDILEYFNSNNLTYVLYGNKLIDSDELYQIII